MFSDMPLPSIQQSPQTPSSYRINTPSSSDLAEDSPSFRHAGKVSTPLNLYGEIPGCPVPTKLFEDLKRAQSTPAQIMNECRRPKLDRDTLGDLPDSANIQHSWEAQQLPKKRSQWFEDAFASRDPYNCPRERIQKDSVIIAEIRINCGLGEGIYLLPNLTFHLAQSYQRPDSCIMITVEDSSAITFRGTNEPAYLLTITALPSEIAPTKNKRITALTQDFLHDLIGIPPNRGIIRFTAIAEENLATAGTTTLGEIEALSRPPSGARTISRAGLRRTRKDAKPTLFNLSQASKSGTLRMPLTPPTSNSNSQEEPGTIDLHLQLGRAQKLKKRNSLMAFFGR